MVIPAQNGYLKNYSLKNAVSDLNDKFVYVNIDMNNDSKKVKILWNTKSKTHITNFNKLRNSITDGN